MEINGPDSESIVPGIADAELELLARREAAMQVVGYMEDILEAPVSVNALVLLAGEGEASEVRLRAKRALRCIASVAMPNSVVIETIGGEPDGLYHYTEGVMVYGASEDRYMRLVKEFGLNAEEATGLYELRNLVAKETDGQATGFPYICSALERLGISPKEAGQDPEGALSAMYEAGFIIDHAGRRIFDRPILAPELAEIDVPLGRNMDSTPDDNADWVRGQVEGLPRRYDAEE